MMGRLGNDGFKKLNQLLKDAASRAEEWKGEASLPPELLQSLVDQTWKFGAMFADAHDAKTEHVKVLMDGLKLDVPLTRSAAALGLPWYMNEQALVSLEQAMQEGKKSCAVPLHGLTGL